MSELILVKPSKVLEEKILEYKQEYLDFEETNINGSCGLARYNDFDEWLEIVLSIEKDKLRNNVHEYSEGIGLPDGFVPCTTFWLVNNNKNSILGAIEIRHQLNDYLTFRGGHIGYGIRPSERNKGYAGNMLSMLLQHCKTIGLSKVLITCLKNNIGSAKTIIKNGGILDSEDIDNGETFQRYWINIK